MSLSELLDELERQRQKPPIPTRFRKQIKTGMAQFRAGPETPQIPPLAPEKPKTLKAFLDEQEKAVEKRTQPPKPLYAGLGPTAGLKGKYQPAEVLAGALKQSLAGKPAMMLRGLQVYTPDRIGGKKVDPLLAKASAYLDSLKDPKAAAKIEQARAGKLWPIGEDQKWYKVEAKHLPEVINAWSANVGDQIPIMLSTLAGRALGKVVGKPVGMAAGAAAALITGGPDPTDVATAPAVAAITSKIVEHLGGAAPMVAMEAGGFMDASGQYGIDKDIAEKYARIYGLGSGAIEYAQNLWILSRYKAITKTTQKTILKQVISHLGGSAVEGLEEISQQGLENKLMQQAAKEMKKRHPSYRVPDIKTMEGWKRAGAVGAGMGFLMGGPGTARGIMQKAGVEVPVGLGIKEVGKKPEKGLVFPEGIVEKIDAAIAKAPTTKLIHEEMSSAAKRQAQIYGHIERIRLEIKNTTDPSKLAKLKGSLGKLKAAHKKIDPDQLFVQLTGFVPFEIDGGAKVVNTKEALGNFKKNVKKAMKPLPKPWQERRPAVKADKLAEVELKPGEQIYIKGKISREVPALSPEYRQLIKDIERLWAEHEALTPSWNTLNYERNLIKKGRLVEKTRQLQQRILDIEKKRKAIIDEIVPLQKKAEQLRQTREERPVTKPTPKAPPAKEKVVHYIQIEDKSRPGFDRYIPITTKNAHLIEEHGKAVSAKPYRPQKAWNARTLLASNLREPELKHTPFAVVEIEDLTAIEKKTLKAEKPVGPLTWGPGETPPEIARATTPVKKTPAEMAELAARVKRGVRAPSAVREAEAEMAREAPPAEVPPVGPPEGPPPTKPPGPPLEPPAPLKANVGKLKSKFKATAKAIKEDMDKFRFYPNTPPAFRNAVRIDFIGALDKAYNNVTGDISNQIWGGLDAKDVQKSVEIVFARDQLSRTKLGKGNPEISLEQAQQIHDDTLRAASPAAIASADRFKAVHDQYTQKLIKRGVLDKDQIIEDHIRHFVEEYTPEWAPTFGIPIQLKRPFRGYAKKAVGTRKAYRQDQQAIIDSLMEMEYHDLVEDFIQDQVKIYNIKPKLSREQRQALFGTDKRGYARTPRPGRIYIVEGKRYRAYTPDIPFSRAIYMTADGEAALGNFKNVALLPEDIYNTFRAFSQRGSRPLYLFNQATRYWKSAAILSHFPTFNVNNMIGDTWIAMAQHPNPLALLAEYDTALRYLTGRLEGDFAAKLDKHIKKHHIKQTFVRAEIASGRKSKNPIGWLINKAWQGSDFRESLNRVAYDASLLRAMEKGQGEAMRQAHSWIDTEGLELEDALGKIAREALTDYGAVSKTWRRALSGALTPFGTFYFKTSVRAWRWMGRKPVKALLWFMALPLISTLYNRRRKEIEDLEMMLPDYARNRIHFILGEQPDGTIRVAMPQTIQDVLIGTKIFSVVTAYANRVINGELTPREAALETLREWGLEEYRGLKYLVNPWIRMYGGLKTGTDPYDKAPVYRRDRSRMTQGEIAIDTAAYIVKTSVPYLALTIQTYEKGLPQDMAFRKLTDRWAGKGALGIYDVNKRGQVILEIDGKKVILEWEDIHNIRKRAASEYKYLNQLEDDWVASGQEVNVFLSGKKARQSLLKLYDVWAKRIPELKEEQSEAARIRIAGAALGRRLENVFNAQAFNKWLQVKRSRAKTNEEKRQLAERYSFIQTQRIFERYKALPKTARETYLIEKIRAGGEGQPTEPPSGLKELLDELETGAPKRHPAGLGELLDEMEMEGQNKRRRNPMGIWQDETKQGQLRQEHQISR